MANKDLLDRYEPTIGIECHVQLKTRTKLFARVSNDAHSAEPNTTVSAICFGLPGVLPVLNQRAVELAVRAGAALNAQVAGFSKFDRKHYFYPDLPLGYQITQYDQPILGEGYVDVPFGDDSFRVRIERAHLEADAGKLTHPAGADYSLVDLNRVGTPLLEIVSKPDIHSPAAAKAYTRELYLLMKFADVSDVDLYSGHMRFDVNVSVAKKGSTQLGTRAEVKNLNSFRAVAKAAQFEFERQAELLEKGAAIIQETRGWDEDRQKTFSQRGKEEAHDYRYFPDPDLPPVELSAEEIESISSQLTLLPSQIRSQFSAIGISVKDTETLIDSGRERIDAVSAVSDTDQAAGRFYAQWLLNHYLAQTNPGRLPQTGQVMSVYNLLKVDGVLSSNNAYVLLGKLKTGQDAAQTAEAEGLLQVSNSAEIEAIVSEVIAANAKAADDVKNGEAKAIGFLVGQVMQKSQGQANPQLAAELIKKQLSI